MIGPGKAFDTNIYHVICSNILGGCQGSTGPSSIDPATDKPYGLNFPIITIGDMVNCQKLLLDFLASKNFTQSPRVHGRHAGLQWRPPIRRWCGTPSRLPQLCVIRPSRLLLTKSDGRQLCPTRIGITENIMKRKYRPGACLSQDDRTYYLYE